MAGLYLRILTELRTLPVSCQLMLIQSTVFGTGLALIVYFHNSGRKLFFRQLWLGFTWWHFAVSRFVVGQVQEVAKAVLEEQEVSLVPEK